MSTDRNIFPDVEMSPDGGMAGEKAHLRRQMLARRRQINERERLFWDSRICGQVQALAAYRQADTILGYGACNGEADTWEILKGALTEGKRVALPRVTGPSSMDFYYIASLDELVSGFRGILEPGPRCQQMAAEGFLLAPGAAFDKSLHRMGYGAGFYDRWLEIHGEYVTACGLAYDFQVLDCIPWEGHDRSLDMIVTPTKIYN